MVEPVPGLIKYIFQDKGTVFLAVQRQIPLPSGVVDPFRFYPFFPAKLYSSGLLRSLELVELEWLAGHCARWEMPSGHSVILSLTND